MWKHRISDVNEISKTALCQKDGLVKVVKKKGFWVCSEARKKWDKSFKERYNTPQKIDILHEEQKKRRGEFKIKVFNNYSGGDIKCLCCGERVLQFLTIDHTENNGNEHRRILGKNFSGNAFYGWLVRNNYPSGYTVLCFNCNLGKNVNGGVCPHNR